MKGTRSQDHGDWTTMTISDWTNMKPSEWMDWMLAEWNRNYSNMAAATPADLWGMMSRPGMGMGSGMMREGEHRHGHRQWETHDHEHDHKHHHHHDDCHHCGSDSCECNCCIGDVDLAVYTRLGEQRVIPLVIENDRHRDKQITVELSGWTTRGGSAAPVETILLEPKSFTLASCGEQKITLVVQVRPTQATPPGQDQPQTPAGGVIVRDGQQIPTDVDDCLVATADLRLVGCDHRSIRVAVAILPRDCDPYKVDCGCTCC